MSEELVKQVIDLILGDPVLTVIAAAGIFALFMVFITGGSIKKAKGLAVPIVFLAAIGGLILFAIGGAFAIDIFRAMTGL